VGRWWILFSVPIVIAGLAAACGRSSDPLASGQAETTVGDRSDAGDAAPPDSSSTTTDEDATGQDTAANSGVGATTTAARTPVVYADDFGASILPIFADRCASCHTSGGPGTSHWELTTAKALSDDHADLAGIVATGYMPPWPAGGDSPSYKADRSLGDDQLQAILDWSAAGAPIDVPGDTRVEAVNDIVGLFDPDSILAPELAYAGSPSTIDDYRCQIYDPQLPDGGWITEYEFIPDQTEVVHHAIGYLVPASARAAAGERDGEDGKPGWSCYGSSGLGADDIFLGWAPGQHPSKLPAGTGLWVDPGAFIVVQIHYHYEGSAPPDRSTFAINLQTDGQLDPLSVSQFIAPAEIPCASTETGPLCDRDAALADAVDRYGPEGVQADRFLQLCGYTAEDFAQMTDGTASSSCDIPAGFVGAVGQVVSVLGHEHEIGSWFKMTLNPDRPDERVLLDIPNWDFDWQYNYEPTETIIIEADDVVRLECGWDRSRRDPALEPAYVLWADGTNDEMCFGTISTRPVVG
jgi:mono/diheme cytochrome c family protein